VGGQPSDPTFDIGLAVMPVVKRKYQMRASWLRGCELTASRKWAGGVAKEGRTFA